MLPGDKAINVSVVADDPLSRAGLAALLDASPECEIVAQTEGGERWPNEIDTYQSDVIVWDMGWDVSITQLEDIGERLAGANNGELPIPIVALIPDETFVAQMLSAGIQGILLRDVDTDQLINALLAVTHNLVVLDPTLLAQAAGRIPQFNIVPVEDLTPRESEVLQLVAEGLPNKLIARRLQISEHTVKFHINAIFTKLGVSSRTEAVVYAMRLGLITL